MWKSGSTNARGWKVQMAMIWASQALSLMGFSFSLAFAPYFIQQDLGITAAGELEMWVALFSTSTAVTMGLAAPAWGVLADRYGKRIMLLRANFGGAVCMSLMATVTAPEWLIALRALQGLLTGTMTAAQTFMSASVPQEKRGLAMGGLSAAVYSGLMGGAFFGGLVARVVGYRHAFAVSGFVLLVSGLLVLWGTREPQAGTEEEGKRKVTPPESAPVAAPRAGRRGLRAIPGVVWAVLGLVGWVSLARQFDLSFLPLLVQDIHGKLDADVALWNGLVNACGSVAGLLAGIMAGWLADRVRPFALMAWMAKNIPEGRQGGIFGLSNTARSSGWSVGPMLAGAVATWKLRAVFGVSCVAYLVLAAACGMMLRR